MKYTTENIHGCFLNTGNNCENVLQAGYRGNIDPHLSGAATAAMHYGAIKFCRCQKYEAGQIEQSTTLSIT